MSSEADTLPTLQAILNEMRAGFASINERLQKLETMQYDTKPIWENALKEIADTRQEMKEQFEGVYQKLDNLEGSVTVLSGDVVQIRSAILRLKREEEQPA